MTEMAVPHDLQIELNDDPPASAAFDALPYAHKSEYIDWILQAQRPETRARRVEGTIEMLKQGRRVEEEPDHPGEPDDSRP